MKEETGLFIFEVVGNNMNDGTRSSFEDGDKLIVQLFNINDFRSKIDSDLNSFWIIETGASILLKQIIEYDKPHDTIKYHSLNTAQCPDALIKVESITKIYRVMQRQSRIIHHYEP